MARVAVVPASWRSTRIVGLTLIVCSELLLLPAPVTWSSGLPRLSMAGAALAAGALMLARRGLGSFAGYMLGLVGLATLPPPGRRVLLLVAVPIAAFGVALVALLVLRAVLPPPPMAPSAQRAGSLLAAGTPLALGHVLGIAVMEELAFRGPLVLLAVVWGRAPWRLTLAVVAGAVVFGSAHAAYGWLNMAHACVQGLMWGAMAVLSRSLWPSIAAHALFDAVALLA